MSLHRFKVMKKDLVKLFKTLIMTTKKSYLIVPTYSDRNRYKKNLLFL